VSAQKYCTSCGSPIPDGQGRSCSACYGDPAWGRDGYLAAMMEQDAREQYAREQANCELEQQEQQP
jgi:hypothetical protein